MLGYNIGQSSFFTRHIVSIASSKGTEGSAPGSFGASLFLCSDYIIALRISTVKGRVLIFTQVSYFLTRMSHWVVSNNNLPIDLLTAVWYNYPIPCYTDTYDDIRGGNDEDLHNMSVFFYNYSIDRRG
jgi:hypothetical protein